MLPHKTEQLFAMEAPLDALDPRGAAEALVIAQVEAARAPLLAVDAIAAGAQAMAQTVRAGGTLYYVAAGSSGLMAAADAMELGGTFGIPEAQIRILMAGGIPQSAAMAGDVEDLSDSLARDMGDMDAQDCLIVVSASGTTPYAVEAARIARGAGATIIALANNEGSALLTGADHAICLDTPPEILSGSTRMGAGTAQKIALNALSTCMGVELGHVFQGRMVNLVADNQKLRVRATGIVAEIASVAPDAAQDALSQAGGNAKLACLIALGASPDAARKALEDARGHLGPAMETLKPETT